MTDWRTLCEELLDELLARPLIPDRALIDRARALLAQPEPEVVEPTPSNQLVEQWVSEVWHEGTPVRVAESDLHLAARAAEWGARFGRPAPAPDDRGVLPMIFSETGADDEPELERIICASISGGADYVNNMPRELMLERITPEGSTFARYIQVDADARPDVRPAPVPAGEAPVDLIIAAYRSGVDDARIMAEAERQAAPVPVAVSERPWEREGWCDESGRCWFYSPRFQTWSLTVAPATTERLRAMVECLSLPFHALPLPSDTESGDSNE